MASLAQIGFLPPWANNGWHLLRNEHLPPVVQNFWSYDQDSFSWHPKEYDVRHVPPQADDPLTLTRDYNYYIRQQEPTVYHPLVTAYGGLDNPTIDAIQSDTLYSYPDLRSQTRASQAALADFWLGMAQRDLILPPMY